MTGSVSTRTTGTVANVSFWWCGIDIRNGSEGTVVRIEAGSGVENVAEALT